MCLVKVVNNGFIIVELAHLDQKTQFDKKKTYQSFIAYLIVEGLYIFLVICSTNMGRRKNIINATRREIVSQMRNGVVTN